MQKINSGQDGQISLEKRWINLCIASLGLGGIYSIFIVLLRTPGFSDLFLDKSIFKVALIIHVDLTVLFWLLSFVMMIISERIKAGFSSVISQVTYLVGVSIALVAISPFFGQSKAFMNNYIPILHNFLFIMGIGIFFACFVVVCSLASLTNDEITRPMGLLGILICLSFFISYLKISSLIESGVQLDQAHYYELLFWGGGHLMQFFFLSGMIIVWYSYAAPLDQILPLKYLLALSLILCLPAIYLQLRCEIDDAYYIQLFREHMKIFGGIPFFIAIFTMIFSYSNNKGLNLQFTNQAFSLKAYSIVFSFFLFSSGGVIALIISGKNVTIPAHYHGSIVGITIIFMSYIYIRISEIYSGLNFKSATFQLLLYSFGQFVHIMGLGMSGGYGALRKTPGVDLPFEAKIAMGFMGAGGLLAIAAGLIFVYICLSAIMKKN
ncbi:MAG: hypothetical protein SFT91_05150 [Rickettsiaceae bacterium]|nr:hypothetical protein [Rickettsiaceae bacterium]